MAYRGTGGLGPYLGGGGGGGGGGGLTPLFGLRRELDRLFDDAWSGRESGSWIPAVDVRETENDIAIDIELPGVPPDEVTVSVDNGVLTVSGVKREERREGDEGRFFSIERRYGTFVRQFTLPAGVNEEQIEADFDNGVLTIRIPKAALPQPRKVEVGNRQRNVGGGQGRQQVSSGRGRKEKGGDEDPNRRVAGGGGERGERGASE